MRPWARPLFLSLLLPAVFASGGGLRPVLAADPAAADPDQGAVVSGAYVNPYFGLSYPLPPGWREGPRPPPPSAAGYYVLGTPAPPSGQKATILIAAQDAFFAPPTLADADVMARNLIRALAADAEADGAATRRTVMIAGHPFVAVGLSATALSRVVYATVLRCHVVIFTFTGADAGQLNRLAASLGALSLSRDAAVPDCLRNYATAQTLLHKAEPAAVGPPFARIPVRIVIGADGAIDHIHVIHATAQQQKSLEDTLRQWRFIPYLVSGRPRAVETGLTFEFGATRP
jgi:hypothetical protein